MPWKQTKTGHMLAAKNLVKISKDPSLNNQSKCKVIEKEMRAE
jgi:hypothetical protein